MRSTSQPAAPVARRSFFEDLRLASFAGAGLALVESLWLMQAGAPLLAAWRLALLNVLVALWIGLGVYAFGVLSRGLGWVLRGRVGLATALLLGALLSPVYGILLSGPGVSQTWLGKLGPWLLIALTVAVVLFYQRTCAALRRRALGPWVLLVLHLLAAALAWGIHVSLLAGLYPLFHSVLVIALALFTQLGLAEILGQQPPRSRAAKWAMLSLFVGLHALLVVLPVNAVERARLSRSSLAGSYARSLRALVDLDGDGFAAILGGEDCDDTRADRGPLQRERAVDGVDQNCDGLDGPRPPLASSYRGDPSRRRHLRQLAQGRPTVILLVDALRADRLADARFAKLRALASSSINFVHALAPSASTTTSLQAMLSGELRPDANTPTLFERLRPQRAAVVGLDAVLAYLDRNLPTPALRGARRLPVAAHTQGKGWGSGVDRLLAREISDRAFAALDGDNGPALLLVHYFDLHQWKQIFPEAPPRKAYDRVLAALDVELGRWLRRAGSINLVLLGDHGEFLGEHGKTLHTRVLARELVHVPLLISIPGVSAERIDEMVGLIDLAPTLSDLLGLSGTPASWAGRSLLAVGPGPLSGSRALLGVERDQLSLAHKGWRLIYDRGSGAMQLFNWSQDSREQRDRAGEQARRVQVMKWDLFTSAAREKIR